MLREELNKRLLTVVLCAGIAMPLAAQEADPAVEATHNEIRLLKSGVEEAFNAIGSSGADGDIEPLLQYVHDDVVQWLSRHVLLNRLVAGETWPP